MYNQTLNGSQLNSGGRWSRTEMIPGGEDLRIVVGEYEDRSLIPKLVYDYEPNDPERMGHTEVSEELPDGTIRLVMYFQSYSSEPMKVTVREVRSIK